MMPRARSASFCRDAFTLVEMLVSVAVLSLMLAGVAVATSFVSSVWINGVGMMDNFTKARVALTLLDRDIQMMVLRRDVAAFPVGTSGNSTCAFYANVQGNPGQGLTVPDTRTVSLVQYQLDPSTETTAPTLERLNYGMNFLVSNGATPSLATPMANGLTPPGNARLQTETVFNGVVLFQVQFVDGTGAIQPAYNYSTTQFYPVPPSNSRSVIASMLVLNNAAYNLAVNRTGTISTLQGLFSSLPVNTTYSQYWNSVLAAPPPAFYTLPPVIRSGLQVFERHIPLPMTTPSS